MKKQIFVLFIIFIISSFLYSQSQEEQMKMVVQGTNPGHVAKILFSKDGEKFVTVNMMNRYIKVWSITGRLLNCLDNEKDIGLVSLSFSPDGKHIAFSDGVSVKIWDLDNEKLVTITNGKEGLVYRYFQAVAFAPDNKSVFVGSGMTKSLGFPEKYSKDDFSSMLKKISNKSDRQKIEQSYYLNEINGQYYLKMDLDNYTDILTILVTNGFQPSYSTNPVTENTLELWGVDGKYKKQIGIHSISSTGMINNIIVSPDGTSVMTYGADSVIKIWNPEGSLMTTLQADNPYYVSNMGYNAKGNLFGWISISGIKICNLNGTFLKNISRQTISPDIDIDRQIYAESGAKGDQSNYYFVVRVKDFDNKVLVESKQPLSSILYTKISPNGKLIIAGCLDGTVNIFSRDTGEIVTVINDKRDWLSYTYDGYWDASPNGGKLVAMVKGMEVYGVDQFAIEFNRPDIILKRLGFDNKDLIDHYYNQYEKRLKKAGLNASQLVGDIHVPEVKINSSKQNDKMFEVNFSVSDSKYNLKRYNVYVNDIPVYGAYGKDVSGKSAAVTETIELATGDNKIEVSALNEKGAESFRTMVMAKYNKQAKGNLYYLGFGVSKYKNESLNLQYADKDAIDLGNVFSKMKSDRYNNVYIKTFTNDQVSIDAIRNAKDFIKNAKVDDTFILFIAGHGVHDTDKEATYYYIIYDTDVNNLSGTAANFDLIENIMQGIGPRNKLFLMDTCESGEVDTDVQTKFFAMADSRHIKSRAFRKVGNTVSAEKPIRAYLAQKDRYIYNDLIRRSGAIVFSSCRGGEFSYESDSVKNGFFSKEIMNAFTSKDADKDNDGVISIDELKSYVSSEVSSLSDGYQNPTVDRDNIFQKFGFQKLK